ncbi:MAG: SIR2 family protein, partial [Desulfobulbaceae bacterium]|nr:SIR2 family protein [Desulfobulbaceae bacterium]
MEIPKILISHIKDGQVVLFLGSGAALGAKHDKGISPPLGNQLSSLLADKFLGGDFKDRSLAQIAELAISETSLYDVQNYIYELFDGFYPADFHKMIPLYRWAAIASTNYDLIIERAYTEQTNKVQDLVVFKKNGERVEEKARSNNSVFLLKLHGSITDITDPSIQLILTPEQYITHRNGRSRLFDRLKEFAYEFPILFVGYSMADPNIRAILLELSSMGESLPRSYMLMPNIPPAEKRLWEYKRFTCIDGSFEIFLNSLNNNISRNDVVLSTLKEELFHPLFEKYSKIHNIKPSQNLLALLESEIEYIDKNYKLANIEAKVFYKGYFDDFTPISRQLDVRRTITDEILLQKFLEGEETRLEKVELVLIKGHAGSGKSVLLRRLAWEASLVYEKICLYAKQNPYISYDSIYELHSIVKDRIFLFIDHVVENKDLIYELLLKAKKDKIPLTIISSERSSEWNTECEELKKILTDEYEIKYLNEKEISSLINLLDKYDSLGHLKGLSRQEQINALSKQAGRQLLVALHEATLGKPFSDIILDEYNSIKVPEAKALYLTICVLHRIGVRPRAGLISRLHGIPFNMFKEKFFAPLEFIVFAARDSIINDYYYSSRHSHIAEMVFERVLVDDKDRYNEYLRLINNLDIDYKSDHEAFKGLMNARSLLRLFNDESRIENLFLAANERVKDSPKLLQQEAIFQIKRNPRLSNLDSAEKLLSRAENIAPYDRAISHSISILSLE